MATTVSASASAPHAGDDPVLQDDERGVPRSLRLLAALVEAESRHYAAAAPGPAESELIRAFRGGAGAGAASTPSVPIGEFLERIHRFIQLEDVRHVIEIQATCYVLAGIYLARFFRSPAARESGILVEPSTAHRLLSAALFVGAKFGADNTLPKRWTVVFETSSDCAIRAREMAGLERQFLRAVDYRLFVGRGRFDWFCRVLEKGPAAERGTGSCRGVKRTAAGEEEEDGDERRRVRPCLPPPAVASN
jgi:hypothetical protein